MKIYINNNTGFEFEVIDEYVSDTSVGMKFKEMVMYRRIYVGSCLNYVMNKEEFIKRFTSKENIS